MKAGSQYGSKNKTISINLQYYGDGNQCSAVGVEHIYKLAVKLAENTDGIWKDSEEIEGKISCSTSHYNG